MVTIDIAVRNGNGNSVIRAFVNNDTYEINALNDQALKVEHVLALRQALKGVVGEADCWMEIELDIIYFLEKATDYYSIT